MNQQAPVLLVVGADTSIGFAVVGALARAGERVVAVSDKPAVGLALEAAGAVVSSHRDVASALASWEVERAAVCRRFDYDGEAELTLLCSRIRGGVVVTSSSSVYEGSRGARCGRPLTESEAPQLGVSESVLERAAREGDNTRALVSLRLFDVYGGEVACGSSEQSPFESRLRSLCGSGVVNRQWAQRYCGDATHVDEAASWVCCALMRLASIPAGFQAINAARGVLVRGRELVKAADSTRALRDMPPVRFTDEEAETGQGMRADVQKMRSMLQMDPSRCALVTGVEKATLEEAKVAKEEQQDDKEGQKTILSRWLRGALGRVLGQQPKAAAAELDDVLRSRLPTLLLEYGVLSFCDAASLSRLTVAVPNWGVDSVPLKRGSPTSVSQTRMLPSPSSLPCCSSEEEDTVVVTNNGALPERAAALACAVRRWGRSDARGRSWCWLLGRDGTWRRPLAWSAACSAHSATVHEGRCYVLGGLDARGAPTAALRVLRMVSSSETTSGDRVEWLPTPRTRGAEPPARFGHGATVVDGTHLAVFGGRGALGDLADLHLLTLPADLEEHYCWSTPLFDGPTPPPRAFATVATLKTKNEDIVVVWGGCVDGSRCLSDESSVWSLDVKKQNNNNELAWSRTITNGPSARYAHATAPVRESRGLVVLGGRDDENSTLPLSDAYELALDDLTRLPVWSKWCNKEHGHDREEDAMLLPRRSHHSAVEVSEGKVLALGGMDGHSRTLDEAFILERGKPVVRFEAAGSGCGYAKRRAFTATKFDESRVLVLGGQDDTKRLDDIALLSLA